LGRSGEGTIAAAPGRRYGGAIPSPPNIIGPPPAPVSSGGRSEPSSGRSTLVANARDRTPELGGSMSSPFPPAHGQTDGLWYAGVQLNIANIGGNHCAGSSKRPQSWRENSHSIVVSVL
jgi:hypothetical protein